MLYTESINGAIIASITVPISSYFTLTGSGDSAACKTFTPFFCAWDAASPSVFFSATGFGILTVDSLRVFSAIVVGMLVADSSAKTIPEANEQRRMAPTKTLDIIFFNKFTPLSYNGLFMKTIYYTF